MYCMCYNWWVLCRTQTHDSAQELNERVKRFTSRVRYTGRQSKSRQTNPNGIGRRIVVGQAEVRSTSNHLNKAEALNARNTRGAVEKQGTYHETQTYDDTTRNKHTRTIYTHTCHRY